MPKGVVWRQEDIFFGAARRGESRRGPDHRPVGDRRKSWSSTIRPNGCALSSAHDPPGPYQFVHPRLSGRSCTRAGNGPCSARCSVAARSCSFSASCSLDFAVGARSRRTRTCEQHEPHRRRDRTAAPRHVARQNQTRCRTRRACGSSARAAAMLSGAVKEGLLVAVPSLLAIVEGIGASSESPAEAVAVNDPLIGAVPPSLTFAAKAETMLRRRRPAPHRRRVRDRSDGSPPAAGSRSGTTRTR